MTKEQILETLQDVILTLKSPNFKEPKIQLLWEKKWIEVQKSIGLLSDVDKRWLESAYSKWAKEQLGSGVQKFSWL